ncbi:MAG TPA: sugar phosphate isomerase/epimerase [Terracidiphilus sp.]|nr:sugar phosphate isomerase/epimerase [Terracidiphilus sp.]
MKTKTRREILQGLGVLSAAGSLSPFAPRSLWARSVHPTSAIRFGVQLNAFPIDPKKFESFLDALAQVRQIGYQGFESSFRNLSGQFNHPGVARQQIEQTGLTFFGIHIFFPNEGYDQQTHIAAPSVYEPVARGGAALGAKHLILSGAPAPDADALKRKVDALNAAGRFAQSAGISVAYHNHWWEFESKIGEIEALYTQTDPAVHFVLDAGHAYHGGANVPAFIRAHSQRIVGFHLRDYRNGRLVTLGTGTFPLAEVAATIKQIGWKGWVENEEEREDLSKNGAEVIAPAYKAMKEAFAS